MTETAEEGETNEQRFKRIATPRTRRIIEHLRLLGNCSNTRNYSYTQEDLDKIFTAIESELKYVKSLFKPTNEEFSLD